VSIFSWLRRWVGGRYWRGILSIIGGGLIFVGLFGPWIWRGYDPTLTFNIKTQKYETHYNAIYEISPLYARVIEDGVLKATFWFYDFNLPLSLSLSAIGFIIGAVLCLVSFGRWRVSLAGFFFYITSFLLFFLSFGRNPWVTLGLRTFFGWGLRVTVVGGFVIFTSVIVNLIWREY